MDFDEFAWKINEISWIFILDARNELRQRAEDVDARGAFLETCAQETAGWSTSAKCHNNDVYLMAHH